MNYPVIMVVEDDANMRFVLEECLRDQYTVVLATDGQEALDLYHTSSPDLVLLDIKIPKLSGLQVLERIKHINPDAMVVVLTGYATVDMAVEAMKQGAYDFISKPFEVDKLIATLGEAAQKVQISKENLQARNTSREINDSIYNSMVCSRARDLDEMISTIAASEYTILVEGESGTGKSLVAKDIHNRSKRKDGPFVLVDCASLPDSLIESELFGYEKGAFTGANSRRVGKIERADGGTLFLDEISTLNPNAQAKLLTVIQNREFERLGGNHTQPIDVRIIVASNQSLKQMVIDKTFRHDLYYRLNVFSVELLPLRERKEDIIPMAYYFINKFGNRDNISLSTDAALKLKIYEWPGNIRELENSIKHALILIKDKNTIESIHLPLDLNQGYWKLGYKNMGLKDAVEKTEQMIIEQALVDSDFNIDKCAETLKISRRTLYYRINKFDIDIP